MRYPRRYAKRDMSKRVFQLVEKGRREAFSQIYSASPTLATDGQAQDGSGSGSGVGGAAASKVAATLPTKKAAMEIEAGGGMDVREGQASVSGQSHCCYCRRRRCCCCWQV